MVAWYLPSRSSSVLVSKSHIGSTTEVSYYFMAIFFVSVSQRVGRKCPGGLEVVSTSLYWRRVSSTFQLPAPETPRHTSC